jgi:sugar phosphate permease
VASEWLIKHVGWRWSFVIFALAGVAWAVSFYAWFRDDPAEHPDTNEAERKLIASGQAVHSQKVDLHGPIPWNRVLRCSNIWLLGVVMMMMSAIYEVLSSWYPTYLQKGRGATQDLSSLLASLVLAAGACGTFLGGWLTDWLLQKTGNQRWARTAQAIAGAGLAAFGILASIRTDSTVTASAFVALAAFGVQLQLPSWWASATQVSGRHLGALFGMMNMMGMFGRILFNQFTGGLSDWRKSLGYTGRAQWDPVLYAYVAAALIGLVLWSLVDPVNTVDSQSPATT